MVPWERLPGREREREKEVTKAALTRPEGVFCLVLCFRGSFASPPPLQNNGTTEHQVESFIRKKLESLLKESQIRDKEDPDSFTVRALLKATHEGLNAHLKQVQFPPALVLLREMQVLCRL